MPKPNRLYHSALVKADETVLMLTGPVKTGQYGAFVPVKLADGSTATLNAENDQIANQLRAVPQGVWVHIQASGTKESASLDIVDEDGDSYNAPAGAPAPRQPARNGSPAPRQESAQKPSLEKVMRACIKVAHDIDAAYTEAYKEPMSENVRTLAISMAISVLRGDGPLTDPK